MISSVLNGVVLMNLLLLEVGAQELDEFWEKLVLGAIGELIDPGNEVTGVRVIHKVMDVAVAK